MTQPKFNLPKNLELLQNKLLKLRESGKLLLQNGDMGVGSAPSNIALIKYWGKSKLHFQEPDNSSISLTLDNFKTTTSVTVLGRFFPKGQIPDYIPPHKFCLTDALSKKTTTVIPTKLSRFLENILHPFAKDIGLNIQTTNHFPTACGLASSASGLAALCFAIDNLLNLEKHFTLQQRQYWLSQWARLGSGSALRSTSLENARFVSWEVRSAKCSVMQPLKAHNNWNQLKHCVFVLDSREKTVTSSEGHLSAEHSPLHKIRVSLVNENFDRFKHALKNFDFEFIANFTEEDALNMHAVMQTGNPPAIYLRDNTSLFIAEFIKFRHKNKIQAFWTLDAGPNVHILYLEKDHTKLMKFYRLISKSLKQKIKIYE